MDRKIGNIFFITSMLSHVLFGGAVQLRMQVLDNNGQQAEQVAAQVPFMIEVAVVSHDSTHNVVEIPTIEGIKQFVVENKTHVSTINSIINGQHTSKKIYRFVVRAEKQGLYTVGPAYIMLNSLRVRSNILTIHVGAQKKLAVDEPLLQWKIDKEAVYLGEQVACTLRFYPGKSASLEGVSQPEFPDCTGKPLEGPFAGTEIVEGAEQKFIEWKTTIIPSKAGVVTIPCVAAVFKMPKKRKGRAIDMFDRIFSGGVFDQKQVFSNVATITVQPLPAYDHVVHGIGTFSDLQAHVDHAVAKEGEGIVYRLQLIGSGNIESASAPELIMPEGLRCYASKSYMEGHANAAEQKKYFEYIVQGVVPGLKTIGGQQFTYFDLKDRRYKTIESNPIDITIKAPLVTQQKRDGQSATATPSAFVPVLAESGPWMAHEERSIPWRLFLLLCAVPLMVIGLQTMRRRNIFALDKIGYFKRKSIYKAARKSLRYAQKHNDYRMVYMIFIEFFAQKLGISPAGVSDQTMLSVVQKRMPAEKFSQWSEWIEQLLSYSFGAQLLGEDDKQIFKYAEQWLLYLESIL
jgi:BatD DUF11 like domain